MASAAPALSFDRAFEPQTGQAIHVADGITRVTASEPARSELKWRAFAASAAEP